MRWLPIGGVVLLCLVLGPRNAYSQVCFKVDALETQMSKIVHRQVVDDMTEEFRDAGQKVVPAPCAFPVSLKVRYDEIWTLEFRADHFQITLTAEWYEQQHVDMVVGFYSMQSHSVLGAWNNTLKKKGKRQLKPALCLSAEDLFYADHYLDRSVEDGVELRGSMEEAIDQVDLNADGQNDILLVHRGYCGSGGCTHLAYIREDGCARPVGEIRAVEQLADGLPVEGNLPELYVLKNKTNGLFDLVGGLRNMDCGAELSDHDYHWRCQTHYKFSGKEYHRVKDRTCLPDQAVCGPWRVAAGW